jgi:hypothetical protein
MTSVVVAGALANKPGNGGEAWVRLGWLRGLAALGVDVHLVETADVAVDGPEARWWDDVLRAAGVSGTLLDARGDALRGDRADVGDRARAGAPLLDLSGALRDPALVASFRRRAYVDLDPGWTQLWDAAGLLGDVLDRYDVHLTVGDAVPTCGLPQGGRHWQPVRPVVVLADWPRVPAVDGPLTTVGSWRSPSGTMPVDGQERGGKARSWRPLADLPTAVPQPVRAVVAAHPADTADLDRLRAGGWDLQEPASVATPDAYRAFVQASAGELSVAQELYVATRCGWTSDRTAAYLASGRPAVVQDTGSVLLGSSPALRGFATCAEAADACRAVAAADPDELADEAHRLAATVFASDVVLPRVLDLVGGV